jgi:hypothetical protein
MHNYVPIMAGGLYHSSQVGFPVCLVSLCLFGYIRKFYSSFVFSLFGILMSLQSSFASSSFCIFMFLRPPLWSSAQSSWLQIQRSVFNSWRHVIFWEVVGLKRSPLSLVSKIEELLERKSSGFGLESREDGRRDPSHWPRGILHPQKLALTSPTSGCRSVGRVHSRIQTTVFCFVCVFNYIRMF